MKTKKILSVLTAIAVAIGCFTPIIGSAEDSGTSDAEAKVKYKASDAWNEKVTRDSVWQFLYRNNLTAKQTPQYVEYTQAKAGNSGEYAAPTKNADGTYNYGASGANQIVYADKTDAPGRRNALGKYWARPSVATGSEPLQGTGNRIVKQFTAPRKGNVIISAEDMSGDAKIYNRGLSSSNSKGAVVRIVKKADGQSDTELWKYTFSYNSETTTDGVESIDFKGINVDLAEGDKLWFEISSETGGSAYGKQVFWDPTVTYFDGGDTVYCSASGTEKGFGGEDDPCTLSRAIDIVKDGGTIVVDGTIMIDGSFVWSKANKAFTVKGKDENSEINISALGSNWFNINTDVTFENIKIGCAASTDGIGVSRIAANGHHVVIKDTVTTTNVANGLIGGAARANVASTNLEVYGGNYNGIMGGCDSDNSSAVSVTGNCALTVGGNVNSDLNDKNWDKVRRAVIHGGGYGGSIGGESVLNLTGNAKAKYVYGGQNGGYAATNTGKVTVNVQGGSFMNIYAILKNTKSQWNDSVKQFEAVNVDNTKAEINMTGGKVEALIGSQDSIKGDVTINALGGTVTRRIIAGTYNDFGSSGWVSSNHVIGNATAIIGSGLNGMTDKQVGNGIFGGSRMGSNPNDETGTLIFTGGAYDKFETAIGRFDTSSSNHDYIADVSANGTVALKSSGILTVTPNTGYYAVANEAELTDGELALASGYNKIEFADANVPRINGLSVSEGKATVTYRAAGRTGAIVVAALYDGTNGTLLDAVSIKAKTTDGAAADDLNFNYKTEEGKQYIVSAMLWSGFDSIAPLCGRKVVTVNPTSSK